MPAFDLEIAYPPRLKYFFDEPKRYYVLYGGRGSAKSWAIALKLIGWALTEKHRILCCREIQISIKQSVKRLLEDTISRLGVRHLFDIRDQSIVSLNTGSEFIFAGLWNNVDNIKSMEGITICWVEEAQTVSATSMDVLIPTIRQAGSFFIFSMNPRFAADYVYANFIAPEVLRPSAKRIELNYSDNPWFPDVLRDEMEWDRVHHPSKYRHVWLGELMQDDDALVFHGNVHQEWFDTHAGVEFMIGCDFGFSQDPLALNRSFMSEDETTLFIDYEAGGIRIELDHHPQTFDEIPEITNWPIIADSARPETISYLRRKGYPIIACDKYKGCVEDGVSWLQSKKIIIHPRCRNTYDEFRTHKFRRHAQTNEIMPKPEDKNNHYIDATRMAWQGQWIHGKVQISVM